MSEIKNMQIGENKMTAKKNTAKNAKTAVKTAKTAKAVEVVVAPVAPAAKEQPMWQGKPISAAGLTYHKRREAGVCVKCGEPLDPSSKLLCTAHLEYHNKWHANRKAQAAAKEARLKELEAEVAAMAAAVATLPAAPKKSRKSK